MEDKNPIKNIVDLISEYYKVSTENYGSYNKKIKEEINEVKENLGKYTPDESQQKINDGIKLLTEGFGCLIASIVKISLGETGVNETSQPENEVNETSQLENEVKETSQSEN